MESKKLLRGEFEIPFKENDRTSCREITFQSDELKLKNIFRLVYFYISV